jgi:hypothetical protein
MSLTLISLLQLATLNQQRKKVMSMDKFRDKKMHIDGIKEINNVDDYEVHLIKNPEAKKS